ncbi:hypothetical protein ABT288_48025 [Streptomyces sp. NPDC001093]|uniref:hypothetical protein n=1 Tax=Streptomyces sp. NPDC001093 TaxID=3154376 RepID=UPI0033240429
MPAGADLTLGAGDLPAVEVDVEIVAVEAVVLAVLAGGIARQWAVEGDLVFALGSFQVDQGGVAAVDQVLGRQQPRRARRAWIPGRAWPSFVAAEVVATSVITLTPPEAHVSVTCAANPFQLMMCPWRT